MYVLFYKMGGTDIISPGIVGSVGDINQTYRLRHDTPDSKLRFNPYFGLHNASRLGSNVQDGYPKSFTGGGGARLLQGYMKPSSFKNKGVQVYQDYKPPDCSIEPILVGQNRTGWTNLMNQVYQARRTGEKFLPLPGPFVLQRGQVSRGPQPTVQVIDNREIFPDEIKHNQPRIFENRRDPVQVVQNIKDFKRRR
jgi:hypothetical protein